MLQLIETLLTRIPATFQSDDYRSRIQELQDDFQQREDKGFQELAEQAREQQITLLRTPHGYTLGPMRDGKLLTPDQFSKLPPRSRSGSRRRSKSSMPN
ncbi:hypothetical protein [Marinobacterium aestuariivivens]|uniref:Uncharacterized protein n=1 Tax=Marinobacterium aestuariivivens TaxID=1698799 RepID=A0ABW2A1Q3_9GAMM